MCSFLLNPSLTLSFRENNSNYSTLLSFYKKTEDQRNVSLILELYLSLFLSLTIQLQYTRDYILNLGRK